MPECFRIPSIEASCQNDPETGCFNIVGEKHTYADNREW